VDLWGKVDILINNAGILRDVSFHKMSDADWEAVYRVHLRGTFAVTRAAWPLMREQGYGRVVMASSAAGLYGNFGQANYAAMKMAMVGLANTLAIEGARRNIAVNVVCPVASSRMTETVLPDELLSSLRADLVAPIVAYLCHESCADNGAVVECGGGWAGKLRRQRAKGVFFPAAQNPGAKGFEMEDVARAWKTICSYEDADYPETNQDVFGVIMEHVEAARASKL
ncbi:HSD17B4, partial [Symbiodinium sp. KB8]